MTAGSSRRLRGAVGPRVAMRRAVVATMILVVFAAGAAIAAIAGTALIVYVPYAGIGAILVVRRPDNTIGWLLTAIGWTFAISWLPVAATGPQLEAMSAPSLVLITAWVQWWWSLPMTLTLVTTLAIVFPSGRLPGGRWRRPARLMLSAMALATAVAAVWPLQVIESSVEGGTGLIRMPNPLGLIPVSVVGPGTEGIVTAVGRTMFAALVLATASLVVRYRRSIGLEHMQLRWLVAGLASVLVAVPLGFLLLAVLSLVGAENRSDGVSATAQSYWFVWLPATISFALPPIGIGIAVTRYRLYEIDRLISRTIGWAVVTAVLVAVFGGGVVVLQAVLAPVTRENMLAVAVSTLVACALFQPLRRRVQHAVDRRFDRALYDGQRTVDAFAGRLRSEVDLTTIRTSLATTADEAVRPTTATVWLVKGTGLTGRDRGAGAGGPSRRLTADPR